MAEFGRTTYLGLFGILCLLVARDFLGGEHQGTVEASVGENPTKLASKLMGPTITFLYW